MNYYGRQKREQVWTHDKATCQCVRCTGFQPGHKLSPGATPTHGAFLSPIKLKPEAVKIAEIVRPLMPVWHPAFEATLQSYCILVARIERAHRALEALEGGTWEEEYPGKPEPKNDGYQLNEDLRKWTASALKHATQLGLTPASAAAIIRDTSMGKHNLGNGYAPPSQERLEEMPLGQLKKLREALTEAANAIDVVDA